MSRRKKSTNAPTVCFECKAKGLKQVRARARDGSSIFKIWRCPNCGAETQRKVDDVSAPPEAAARGTALRVGGRRAMDATWRVEGPVSPVVIRRLDDEERS